MLGLCFFKEAREILERAPTEARFLSPLRLCEFSSALRVGVFKDDYHVAELWILDSGIPHGRAPVRWPTKRAGTSLELPVDAVREGVWGVVVKLNERKPMLLIGCFTSH
jgi:hypothetical protein